MIQVVKSHNVNRIVIYMTPNKFQENAPILQLFLKEINFAYYKNKFKL